MVWFKVDDKLHSHKKAMRAGAEAMGLWALAGSWAADQLTDGWVPDYAALRITAHAEEYAGRLVAAGLWIEGEREGDKGWWFHQWVENGQPTRSDVEKKRAGLRERQRRFRDKRGQYGSSEDPQPEGTSDGNALPNALVTSTPTRPDPYRSTSGGDLVTEDPETLRRKNSRRGSRLPDDFAVTPGMVEWARTHAPHVNGRLETEQFCDYWQSKAGPGAVKLDWVATWRSWMRKAEQQAGRPPSRPGRSSGQTNDDRIIELQRMKKPERKGIE